MYFIKKNDLYKDQRLPIVEELLALQGEWLAFFYSKSGPTS